MKREPPEIDYAQRTIASLVVVAITFALFLPAVIVGFVLGFEWLPAIVAFAGMLAVAAICAWHNRNP